MKQSNYAVLYRVMQRIIFGERFVFGHKIDINDFFKDVPMVDVSIDGVYAIM